MPDDWENGGFGLYIHWPFCQAKCPYCDFNSHVVQSIDQSAWADAYVSEIKRVGAETPGRVLRSVFFGGGTPSLMDPNVVDRVLSEVRATWSAANDIEITLEANPTSVEAGRFRGFHDAGVNRVSLGIQAMNDRDLKALGRLHTAKDAQSAFETARNVFERVSFDLIYARQRQTVDDWKIELKQALSMAIDHVSLYQLTIEEGTAFGDRYAIGKLRDLPNEDESTDMYEATQTLCSNAGFSTYEVSNHAKPEQESRHNLIYWRYGDYLGIGPGAHGRLTLGGQRFATETQLSPLGWLSQVRKTGSGEESRVALDEVAQTTELLLMGMRLSEGVEMRRLDCLGNIDYISNIKDLREIGMVETLDGRLRATQLGRPVLNAVISALLR